MKIEKNCVVSIDYILKDNDGTVLDSSEGQEPLAYIHGTGSLIPGLEKILEGKVKNDQFQAKIAPTEAYGERDESLVRNLSKEEFDNPERIKIGTRFKVDTGDGTMILHVTAVDDTNVTLDANHPMAGVELNFDVTVKDVRAASAEELEHGHAHGAGGHQH